MSVTTPTGFDAAGIAGGIKPTGGLDLALVTTTDHRPVPAAAVFTTNRVQAAPVQVSLEHLADGRAAAVVLNSGNANAATGEAGRRDARRMCELTAESLGCSERDVLVCSTGLIGVPLPMDPVEVGIPKLAASLGPRGDLAAEAILTTDTRTKEFADVLELGDGTIAHLGAMAKGAAMLAPALATMLAVITTDLAIPADVLRSMLADAVDDSFHLLSIDGCTSTNDTVLALANGAAHNAPIEYGTAEYERAAKAFRRACKLLAAEMALDAEGMTKVVDIVVKGARTDRDARQAARQVANSQLVQCSLNGGDPYWGRVLSELGVSGASFDPEGVDISYGDVTVCRDGVAADHDPVKLGAVMACEQVVITCDLHEGDRAAEMTTTDLSHAYIDENRRTS
ncbi:MAG TPA: bifunctional glutamate N-acetyltransferase/amino-acid acetyltransferase ArgJ [Acidimicrobiia bacterium]|nr:bifunctional glutamate N-acetyltransferase/amino-acid acetyltransferase ArgJ [Acidimicrobiia bacterium]